MSTDSRVRARDASTARCSAEFSVVMAIMVHRTHSRGALVSSYVPRRRASESLSYFRNATRPPTSAPCRMIATTCVVTAYEHAISRTSCISSLRPMDVGSKPTTSSSVRSKGCRIESQSGKRISPSGCSDVLFFYTQRIHRAPPPPPAGSPRYTLFGAFCKQGSTEDAPVLAGTWRARWGAPP